MSGVKAGIKKNSLLGQLMYSFFCIIFFVSLIMAAFSLYTILNNNLNRANDYQTDLVKQVGTKVEFYAKDIQIAQYQTISFLIEQDVFSKEINAVNITVPVENNLQNIRRTSQSVHEISVFSLNGPFFTSSGKISSALRNENWMRDFLSGNQSNRIVNMYESDYKTGINTSDDPAIVFLKKVYHPQNAHEVLGIVLVSIKYDVLRNAISNDLVDDSRLFLLDASSTVLCSSASSCYGKTAYDIAIGNSTLSALIANPDETQYLVKTFSVEGTDWLIASIIPKASLLGEKNGFIGLTVIFIFAIILASVWAYLMSRRITKPILNMVSAMNEVGKGNLIIRLPEFKNKDFNALSSGFNAMVDHIGQLIQKLLSKETETANARFFALQAQINPHFLYNTLETIRGIALKNKVESIAAITKSMSQIFRYSISNVDDEVTLWKEFQHVYNYVSIQKFRYKDRLTVHFDLDEEVLQCKTIKLIIQPLVENAICHGLEPQKSPVVINVVCRKDGEKIAITVNDNGMGIPKEKMLEIEEMLTKVENLSGNSIGLYNVHHRLKLFYGEEYGLQLHSTAAKGTEVTFFLPIVLDKQKKKACGTGSHENYRLPYPAVTLQKTTDETPEKKP